MINIVIVGGGFGGVYAAKNLLKYVRQDSKVKVTLISKTNYFLFIPMLHEVATGGLCGHNLAEPFREILNAKNFTFFQESVETIDLKKKQIKTKEREVSYDYLVMATGSKTNFYSTPGAEQNTLTLKDMDDAYTIKNRLIDAAEHACETSDENERRKYATVAIIGAGATGIELAIEIKEFMEQLLRKNKGLHEEPHIILIQRGDRILPQFPELQKNVERALQKNNIALLLNSPVTEVKKGEIKIGQKAAIKADTIIWTAGIQPNIPSMIPQITNKRGSIEVNEFLHVPNNRYVFVIGDCASYTPEGKKDPMPALAQIANQEGRHVAKNIVAQINQKPMKPFTYNLRGILLSLGKCNGAAIIKGIKITGFPAWWLMRTIYLFKIIGTSNKLKTAYEWTLNLFTKRDACRY